MSVDVDVGVGARCMVRACEWEHTQYIHSNIPAKQPANALRIGAPRDDVLRMNTTMVYSSLINLYLTCVSE
jgi:hypothetical protein